MLLFENEIMHKNLKVEESFCYLMVDPEMIFNRKSTSLSALPLIYSEVYKSFMACFVRKMIFLA